MSDFPLRGRQGLSVPVPSAARSNTADHEMSYERSASPSPPISVTDDLHDSEPKCSIILADSVDNFSGGATKMRNTTSYNSARHSDVTVVINGEQINAHRIKLEECELFEVILSQDTECAGVVDFGTTEASPLAIKGLLRSLYHSRYDVDEIGEVPTPEWDSTSLHVEVYILASKYNMEELQQVAASRLKAWVRPYENRTDFSQTLHSLWTSTFTDHGGVRPHFASICLFQIKNLTQEASFVKFMQDTKLGADITMALATSERRVFYKCTCNRLLDKRGKIRETWMRV
ncbi:hypothetical protein B0A48_13206 [Cryoendolithus antarcticus]|uniref:BTB domain-containing protein n=1 Tax=Cryoendolithus antarcticus TaxID=1507870 RepID=A0A1V8SNH7_9PEZI|nr:hypothetical protein B0A48_13206 [Cryoendolithus antarcticus]